MNLTLPTVSVTLGPLWATQLNTAINTIDEHDHTSGKGKKVPTNGLNINTDLSFNSNRGTDIGSLKLVNNVSTLTGASNANSVYSSTGDLYYTNSSGVAVQITDGGSIISIPAETNFFQVEDISGDTVISMSDTFVILNIDTSAPRLITLPAASSVTEGRFYILKDATGTCNTNNITVSPDGSDTIDGAGSLIIDSNFSSISLYSNGMNEWHII